MDRQLARFDGFRDRPGEDLGRGGRDNKHKILGLPLAFFRHLAERALNSQGSARPNKVAYSGA